jgi:Ca-activated chloride channel family protein
VDPDAFLFRLKHGVHPFVSPSAYKQLETAVVPLGATPASFRWASEMVDDILANKTTSESVQAALGRQVRTEDFLAAVDYPVPLPALGPVGVRVYGGPSPFGDGGSRLLQLVVKAGQAPELGRSTAHLTVVVDLSEGMSHGSQLARIRQALHQLVDALGPSDRFSLVAYDTSARLLVERAGREQLPRLHQMIDSLRSTSGANLPAALRVAASVARGAALVDPQRSGRVLLISQRADMLPAATVTQMESLLADLNHRGIRFNIVATADDTDPCPVLARFARAALGRLTATSELPEITSALRESLTGVDQNVARDTRLTVQFNRKTVAEYRLFGHEPTSALGLVEAPLEIDLRAGETATGLFELKLKPTGGNDVGWAELTWQDPATGQARRLRQRISRVQFASSFEESAMALQAATIVAEIAELWRGSPFASRPASSLVAVRDLADRCDPALLGDQSFQKVLNLLDRGVRAGLR